MRKHRTNPFGIVALAAFVAFAAACSDDPMAADDEHADPEGVHLILNGQTVASYDDDEKSWTGELEVDLGETTGTIEVRFVDHDGDAVELEDELTLRVDVEDTSIATFDQTSPGAFTGRVTGHAEGETDVSFHLMHSGHSDFDTTPVHVHVEGPS